MYFEIDNNFHSFSLKKKASGYFASLTVAHNAQLLLSNYVATINYLFLEMAIRAQTEAVRGNVRPVTRQTAERRTDV